jgi:tRNA(adenine34) deaminase
MDAETMTERHTHWMERALAEAERAIDEVPIGAVVVRDDTLIAAAFNQPRTTCDPTAHAEIVALRAAARAVGNYRLPGATVYVTVEPCTMCAGALVHARVGTVVFGAREPRAGAIVSSARVLENPGLNHRVAVVEGILADRCAALVQGFFRSRRGGGAGDASV